MFGKGHKRMSGADKFVMAEGRRVGNIERVSPPADSANRKGNGSVKKTAPTQPKTTKTMPNMVAREGHMPLGKVGTFNLGKVKDTKPGKKV